jgi:predicted RNA polymerase sigma factor
MMGGFVDAAAAYRRALEVVSNNPDRRFLARRLKEVESA